MTTINLDLTDNFCNFLINIINFYWQLKFKNFRLRDGKGYGASITRLNAHILKSNF